MSSPSSVQAKLQAPGAGLPAFEMAWLRILFRCVCSVMPISLGLRWFKREAEKVTSLARRVSAAQASVPVLIDRIVGIEDSSRYWSLFMVLDHLRIVNEGIAQIVESLTHDHAFAQEVRIQDVKPSLDSGPDTIDHFIQTVVAYEAAIARLGKLGRNMRHPHPWFGPMTALDWHCLAAIHHWVHRRQLERIVESVEGM